MEKLIDGCCKPDTILSSTSAAWESIQHSSIEMCANGTVELTFVNNSLNTISTVDMPLTTCFLFTCTKDRNNDFKKVWNTSLS